MEYGTKILALFRSKKTIYASIVIALVAALPVVVRSPFIVGQVFTLMLVFAIYASSWNLLAYSGQGSLGHAAFLGIGGFASSLLALRTGMPPIVGLILGGFVSAAIGFLIGLACVRLKAWFLAMVTFGFSVIIVTIMIQYDSVFGGVVGFPTIPIASQVFPFPFFYATLAITVVSILAIVLIMKSKFGLAFKAIRENELEAKMSGINAAKYRLIAFVISTFFAGLAGGLYAQTTLFIQNSIFEASNSFLPLIMSVIGGLSTIEGPIIGSVIIVSINSFLPLTDKYLQPLSPLFPGVSNVGPPLRLLGLGIFLILVVIFLPKGVISLLHKGYDYLRSEPTKTVKSNGKA